MTAEFDLGRVVEEIRDESRRRRSSSSTVADLERSVEETFQRYTAIIRVRDDGDRLKAALRHAERLSAINHLVPTASKRPLGGPVKKSIRSAVAWYMGAVVSQIRDFIRANLNALRITSAAINTLEERVTELEAEVQALRGERGSEP
jgi:hypothetical protein